MGTQVIEGLTVEVEGSGDPVLMVHGLGGTSNTWTPVMPAVAGSFRVVRPDLPGSGRTPLAASAASPLTIDGFVKALAALARVLGIARAHVLGHSLGTVVCQHLAVRHPALVRSLVLLGPIHAPPDTARQALRERAARARREGMAGIADAIVQGGTAADTRATQPVAVAFVRESMMRQPAEGYAATCEALAAATAAELDRIACPVLLVTGDEDVVAPPSSMRAMEEKLRGARSLVLSRCGHWTPVERAAEVNREIRGFVRSVR
jgi:3-oxoadipate enol-lactonase